MELSQYQELSYLAPLATSFINPHLAMAGFFSLPKLTRLLLHPILQINILPMLVGKTAKGAKQDTFNGPHCK